MPSLLTARTQWTNLTAYGITHAAVDFTCAGIVFSLPTVHGVGPDDFYALVLLYNFLAFGFQPMCGRFCDWLGRPRRIAELGCLLTAFAALFAGGDSPFLWVVMAGVGNSLFHVGAGTICLALTPGRAAAPGIFVAPGAVGLTLGILLGKAGYFNPWIAFVALLLLSSAMDFIALPEPDYEPRPVPGSAGLFVLAFVLLFTAVALRSLVGMAVSFPWKTNLDLLAALTIAVAAGKAAGGWLADRYGWSRIAVGALVVSAPLVAFGVHYPPVAIAGMFLFNMPMAVTLTAIVALLPGKPGLGFGLTCLALFLGMLPALTDLTYVLSDPPVVLAAILAAAGAVLAGLRAFAGLGTAVAEEAVQPRKPA
ncbi:MAG: hypothetical protein AB1646_13880 [Thermodesulfobacteriota bacterium]